MKKQILFLLIILVSFLLSSLIIADEIEGNWNLSWSSEMDIDAGINWSSLIGANNSEAQLSWNSASTLPDSLQQIKNVKAGVDLDGDGMQEFVFPMVHMVDGVKKRTVFVYENNGNDSFEQVWSYTFPGVGDQFTTVDVSDLDGDGNLEILAVHVPEEGNDGPNLYVFEHTGTDNDYGTAAAVTWDLGSSGRDIVRVAKAADVDGDGQQEVVMTAYTSQPSIVIASVSDFSLPVWTTEYVNNDIGGSSPDIAAIGIGDLDGDGTPEVVLTEGATDQVLIINATAANTYGIAMLSTPVGHSVSVHGIDLADADGDGRDEAYIANLQGYVYVISNATADAGSFTTADLYTIVETEEQWLEASTGDLGGGSLEFVIAASNASKAVSYQYLGGDVTEAASYSAVTVVEEDDFFNIAPGGIRVYGLDVAGDMDGDGLPELVFTRGSSRGGENAPGIYIAEFANAFVGTDEDFSLPVEFALMQNYPNPFNPITTITYDIPEATDVRLEIYNIMGQRVHTLVKGFHRPGHYRIQWAGTNDHGQSLASGMYIYRIKASHFVSVKKLVFMK